MRNSVLINKNPWLQYIIRSANKQNYYQLAYNTFLQHQCDVICQEDLGYENEHGRGRKTKDKHEHEKLADQVS